MSLLLVSVPLLLLHEAGVLAARVAVAGRETP
jgi:hypothetical protein